VEEDLMVSERYPILVKTIQHIAHKQIRNRGTFGGAIAHADPAAQLPAASLLLDANLKILSKAGERWVKAVDFFIGPFMTVLEPEELLAEVVLPPMAPRTGGSYQQVSRQKGGYAQAAVISTVTLDASDKVKEARVALFSVGESALLANKPDQVLAGQVPTAEAIEEVAAYVAKNECDPGTDIHGTEEYRRNLVHVLVRRALTEAIQQAKR
jgi:carbon-monoxide dehydrogenase medium subunit